MALRAALDDQRRSRRSPPPRPVVASGQRYDGHDRVEHPHIPRIELLASHNVAASPAASSGTGAANVELIECERISAAHAGR
jgi:hypothetical protein